MKKLTSISAYGFFIFLFFIVPFLLFIGYYGDYINNNTSIGKFLVFTCITILVIVYFFKFFLNEHSWNLSETIILKVRSYRAFLAYEKNTEIISFISHEIRSPILSCMLIVESLLESPELTQSMHTSMTTLYSQLERMESIISRIFSIQRYHMGIFSLKCEPVDIKLFLAQEVDLYRQLHKGIIFRLDCSFQGTLPLDKIQFRQVLTNLFENAAKHISGKKKKIIAINCHKEGDSCVLVIEDTGEGFHGIGLDQLFEKHTRGNFETSGLGLGLYLCRQIVTSHRGTILASNSVKYGGASFEMRLPIKTLKN